MSEQTYVRGNGRPERRKFDVAGFAKQNGLELVGFNYFLVRSAGWISAQRVHTDLYSLRVRPPCPRNRSGVQCENP